VVTRDLYPRAFPAASAVQPRMEPGYLYTHSSLASLLASLPLPEQAAQVHNKKEAEEEKNTLRVPPCCALHFTCDSQHGALSYFGGSQNFDFFSLLTSISPWVSADFSASIFEIVGFAGEISWAPKENDKKGPWHFLWACVKKRLTEKYTFLSLDGHVIFCIYGNLFKRWIANVLWSLRLRLEISGAETHSRRVGCVPLFFFILKICSCIEFHSL